MAVSSSSLAEHLSRLGLVTREDTPPSSHLHTYCLYLEVHRAEAYALVCWATFLSILKLFWREHLNGKLQPYYEHQPRFRAAY